MSVFHDFSVAGLDAKGRIILPVSMRRQFEDYCSRNGIAPRVDGDNKKGGLEALVRESYQFSNAIELMPPDRLEHEIAEARKRANPDYAQRQIEAVSVRTRLIQLEGNGRFTLPSDLRGVLSGGSTAASDSKQPNGSAQEIAIIGMDSFFVVFERSRGLEIRERLEKFQEPDDPQMLIPSLRRHPAS